MKYLILLLLISCATSQQQLDPKVFYKRDICFKLKKSKDSKFKSFFNRFKSRKYRKKNLKENEVLYCGIGVLPELDEYHIEIIADNRLDRLEMTSCHEDHVLSDADSRWSRGVASVTYIPTIEKGKACPLNFGGFSRKKKHAFGQLLREDSRYQLVATVFCNGYETKHRGVGTCHTKEKLVQKIVFNEPVYVTEPANGVAQRKVDCPVLFRDGMKEKEFLMPNRDCFYSLLDKSRKRYFNFILRVMKIR